MDKGYQVSEPRVSADNEWVEKGLGVASVAAKFALDLLPQQIPISFFSKGTRSLLFSISIILENPSIFMFCSIFDIFLCIS